MRAEPQRPMRSMEHAGRQVGILVWNENGTWRSAWRLDAAAWHSVRGNAESEEQAAHHAFNAAAEHIQSGRAVPRRGSNARARMDAARMGEAEPAPAPAGAGAALTSESWRARHAAWTEANEALTRHRDSLPAEPTRPQLAMLRLLEMRAEEARRAMDGQLSRILRPQKRRPGVPRETDED